MPRYIIKTTVDITRANPGRDEQNQIKHAQQSNFNTLLQGIGIRANPMWEDDPVKVIENNEAYWNWTFDVERADVFNKLDDEVGLLKDDLQGVPIIKNLENTDPLDKPIFITSGPNPNIIIKTT